ncbi:2457_t:CDS:2, partial [Scutellospora calospora]
MMQLECLELLDVLTEEQTTKAYETMDETMRNLSFDNPQGLKYFLEVLKDVSLDNNSNDDDQEEEIIYLPSYVQLAPPVKKKVPPPVPPVVPSPKVPDKEGTREMYNCEPCCQNEMKINEEIGVEKEQSKNKENKDETYPAHLKDTKLDELGYEADNEDDNADPGEVDVGGTNEEEREMDELTARITQVSKVKTKTPEGKDVKSEPRIKRKRRLKSGQDNTARITNKKT